MPPFGRHTRYTNRQRSAEKRQNNKLAIYQFYLATIPKKGIVEYKWTPILDDKVTKNTDMMGL